MPRLPASVGKYRIIERLGRGGMSVLYKAEHPTLGIPVVLKKLTLKGDAAHRDRFRREASLMMDLRHENVVGVFDHFKEGSSYYLVMEFVDGRSLAELLAREGAMTPPEALWLTGQIALALAHIHENGVVHRDVKPSNVLISRDGVVKLADFGIAFTPGGGEDITAEGTALGTPSFMAPEQLEDARQADARSDIWSLGVCFFELLTGRKFITGPTPAAIREALPDAVRGLPARLPPGLPMKGRRFLRRTLRLRPESRCRDGAAAVRILGAAGDSPKPPMLLGKRLDGLIVSVDTPAEPTPDAVSDPDPSVRLAAIRSLFDRGRSDGDKAVPEDRGARESSGLRREGQKGGAAGRRDAADGSSGTVRELRKRPGLVGSAALIIVLAVLAVFAPAARDSILRSHTRGLLVLRVTLPSDAPSSWMAGAEARIYRDSGEESIEAARPVLRASEEGTVLASRTISLPAGAYRIAWSLGDTVSWRTFRLPSIAEGRADGSAVTVLGERMGNPPVFSLDLEWRAADAMDGRDIGDSAVMDWERLDDPGGELESGGRYRFTVSADGYGPASFVVPVSPWRRSLVLEADLWPDPAEIVLINNSNRAAMPRINGSGRYTDMSGTPEIRRIGRLEAGETIRIVLPPGEYSVAPGFDPRRAEAVLPTAMDPIVLRILDDGDGGIIMAD